MSNLRKQVLAPTLAVIGLAALLVPFLHRYHESFAETPEKYLIYVSAALLTSLFRLPRPDGSGHLSVVYLFVLISLAELQLGETILIAFLSQLIVAGGRGASGRTLAGVLQDLFTSGCGALAAHAVFHAPAMENRILEPPVRFIIAAGACFAGFNFPWAVIAMSTSKPRLAAFDKAIQLWTLPHFVVSGGAIGLYMSSNPSINWQTTFAFLLIACFLYWCYRVQANRLEMQRKRTVSTKKAYLRTIEALAWAISSKDGRMEGHLRRVQCYATNLGKLLNFSPNDMMALEAASLLHDIGKLAVPDHIISKPGRLTREEFERMKIHPVVGAQILDRVQFPFPVVPMVRGHHERWDGTGYPDGLSGEEIPLGARILTIADTLDALSADRQYRRAIPLDKAVEYLVSEAGRSFDPHLVSLAKQNFQDWEAELAAISLAPGAPVLPTTVDSPSDAPMTHQMHHEIKAASAEVRILFDLVRELGSSLQMSDIFAMIGPSLGQLIPFTALIVFIRRRDRLVGRHVWGMNLNGPVTFDLPIGQGLSGKAAAEGVAVLNEDPKGDGSNLEAVSVLESYGAGLAIPLFGAEGLLGVLSFYAKDAGTFTKEHLRILQALTPKLAQSIENGFKFKQAEDRASTDHLTGLANANALYRHLDQELAVSKCMVSGLAVLVCDLNGFKQVNDTLGHLTGNKLLQVIAAALKDSCRDYDFVARMGGDEFVLVFSNVNRETARDRVRSLRQKVAGAARTVCPEGTVHGSFGLAMFPADGQTTDTLLAIADREMYRDKHEQKSLYAPAFSTGRYETPTLLRTRSESRERSSEPVPDKRP